MELYYADQAFDSFGNLDADMDVGNLNNWFVGSKKIKPDAEISCMFEGNNLYNELSNESKYVTDGRVGCK